MNHLKLPTYKITTRAFIYISFVTLLSIIGISFSTQKAYAATDCSDVFTPLSSFITTGVNANKSFYVKAMNETGVPWEMLAAIHYRETNFSHNNPSNGQGIFQFVNGDGGPYPAGAVSDENFYRQLKFMASKLQSDYVYRGSINRERRPLVANEQNTTLVKDVLYSYNGRTSLYANQASVYGFSPTTQPFEGSPYVMNRFDCQRSRMGIITRDYGTIDGVDTRYGAYTIFSRLRGESFWLLQTRAYSWELVSQEAYLDESRTKPVDVTNLATNQKIYLRVKARNLGSATWNKGATNPVLFATANPSNRNSIMCNETWLNCGRTAQQSESTIAPGEVGSFEFSMTAKQLGNSKEYFNLVAEGKEWFNDFGLNWNVSVNPPTPKWQAVSQQVYVDSARTKLANIDALSPNTTYYTTVVARNTGNTTWSNAGSNPVRLATSSNQDRISMFNGGSWPSGNRPAFLQDETVNPGDVGSFNFTLSTPSSYGTYKEYFRPVAEGQAWMNDIGFHWPLTVAKPTPLWSVVSQTLYTTSQKNSVADPLQTANDGRYYLVIKARNTGNTTWSNTGSNPVRLATSSPQDRSSDLYDSSWAGFNRAANLTEPSVAPGDVGTFEFWVRMPYKANGTIHNEAFRPVVEGSAWMNDIGMYQTFIYSTPDTAWQYVSQSAFTDSSYTQAVNLLNASRDTTYYLQLRLKNTSGATWSQSSLLLGTNSPQDRSSAFYTSSWPGSNRAAKLLEQSIKPGETGTFRFIIKTPVTSVVSNEHFRPVIEGKAWLTDIGLYWGIDTR